MRRPDRGRGLGSWQSPDPLPKKANRRSDGLWPQFRSCWDGSRPQTGNGVAILPSAAKVEPARPYRPHPEMNMNSLRNGMPELHPRLFISPVQETGLVKFAIAMAENLGLGRGETGGCQDLDSANASVKRRAVESGFMPRSDNPRMDLT